jgi:hypothetical protein
MISELAGRFRVSPRSGGIWEGLAVHAYRNPAKEVDLSELRKRDRTTHKIRSILHPILALLCQMTAKADECDVVVHDHR